MLSTAKTSENNRFPRFFAISALSVILNVFGTINRVKGHFVSLPGVYLKTMDGEKPYLSDGSFDFLHSVA